MQISHIALGSNISHSIKGSCAKIKVALKDLSTHNEVRIIKQSRYYRSAAFPKASGPDFINAAVSLETSLTPYEILSVLHKIEADLGRVRTVRWGQRSCDLDLLAVGDLILPDKETLFNWINLPLERQKSEAPESLLLPHPRLQDRAFVLKPMMDIAPEWKHPLLEKTIRELYLELPKELCDEVEIYDPDA